LYEERKKKRDDEIQLFWRSVSQLPRTQSYVASIFMNCQAVTFSLHAWFGVCSLFGQYLGDT